MSKFSIYWNSNAFKNKVSKQTINYVTILNQESLTVVFIIMPHLYSFSQGKVAIWWVHSLRNRFTSSIYILC